MHARHLNKLFWTAKLWFAVHLITLNSHYKLFSKNNYFRNTQREIWKIMMNYNKTKTNYTVLITIFLNVNKFLPLQTV